MHFKTSQWEGENNGLWFYYSECTYGNFQTAFDNLRDTKLRKA